MNFKDRGNKKWNSLMLVEHQKRLKELKIRENDVEKPELDQQQLKEIDLNVQKALTENLPVTITFYENKRIININGKIIKIDEYNKQIKIEQPDKLIKNIEFAQIIDLSL